MTARPMFYSCGPICPRCCGRYIDRDNCVYWGCTGKGTQYTQQHCVLSNDEVAWLDARRGAMGCGAMRLYEDKACGLGVTP